MSDHDNWTITMDAQARNVEQGNRILWCDKWCDVLAVEVVRPRGSGSQQPGRRFLVRLPDGRELGVHYFYNEHLELARFDGSTP